MRCSCRVCGTYRVQAEHGLKSGCVCPDCGSACRDCMGSAQQPLSTEELTALYALGVIEEMDDPVMPDISEDAPRPWRKEL